MEKLSLLQYHSGSSFETREETTSIGNNAFYGNSSLTSLKITSNVIFIGTDAFENTLMNSITFESNTVPYMASSNVFDKDNKNLIVYVNSEAYNSFKNNKAFYGINVQAIA